MGQDPGLGAVLLALRCMLVLTNVSHVKLYGLVAEVGEGVTGWLYVSNPWSRHS